MPAGLVVAPPPKVPVHGRSGPLRSCGAVRAAVPTDSRLLLQPLGTRSTGYVLAETLRRHGTFAVKTHAVPGALCSGLCPSVSISAFLLLVWRSLEVGGPVFFA